MNSWINRDEFYQETDKPTLVHSGLHLSPVSTIEEGTVLYCIWRNFFYHIVHTTKPKSIILHKLIQREAEKMMMMTFFEKKKRIRAKSPLTNFHERVRSFTCLILFFNPFLLCAYCRTCFTTCLFVEKVNKTLLHGTWQKWRRVLLALLFTTPCEYWMGT